MEDGCNKKSCGRIRLLVVFFSLWALVAVCRAWYIAGPGREKFIESGEAAVRREFLIPARRGDIIDAAGLRLVWSERYFDLRSTVPEGEHFSEEEYRILNKIFPGGFSEGRVIRSGLTPKEFLELEDFLRSGSLRGHITPREERIMVDSPAVRKVAGEVVYDSGVWRGTSGWEKVHDAGLSGKAGRFSVMLDRYRNWIPRSIKIYEQPEAGKNIKLDIHLAELESEAGQ